jgi:FlgD Ig-like domain
MQSKLFIIFILFLFSFSNNAQILNGDFEIWTTNFNPDNWISNNAFVYTVITKSSDKHLGQYALRGEVVNFDSSSVPPLLYGGSDGSGFNVSQRYASLDGYYKFAPNKSDIFSVILIMYKENISISAKEVFLSPTPDYAKFSIPVNYMNSEIPDRIFMEFSIYDSSKTSPANIGSYFLIDDLELTGEAATDVENYGLSVPEKFQVYQNYPNPFNPSTSIKYSIPEASRVIVSIYDINGNLISAIADNNQNAGTYEIKWNGKNNDNVSVVSGIYLCRVQAGNCSKILKMVLLK